MQTRSREIKTILKKYIKDEHHVNLCADELLKMRAFELPPSSGMDWMIVAGAASADIAALADKEQAEQSIGQLWEQAMGYNPLPWHSNGDLQALLKFLMDKTAEEIAAFAEWSHNVYNGFSPAKARQFPRRVIDLWPLAFMDTKQKKEKGTQAQMAEIMAEMEKEHVN